VGCREDRGMKVWAGVTLVNRRPYELTPWPCVTANLRMVGGGLFTTSSTTASVQLKGVVGKPGYWNVSLALRVGVRIVAHITLGR